MRETKCYCDGCKKEIKSDSPVLSVDISIKQITKGGRNQYVAYGTKWMPQKSQMELCEDCATKLHIKEHNEAKEKEKSTDQEVVELVTQIIALCLPKHEH